ncbi:kinetochore protein Spc24 [Cryptococcus neoformans]|uniref:Kinetochore protein Spc24 n=2 Tax=Cryptococcus neoformans TaxID=5207 RepID=A0A854QJH5_CRYNE|nr:kinetochore protein Spc24, fungi type [Cryptococcus neoformans var. grubii H99]AUB22000.1 kinetochore protein Spc24, fungi type [Cryptococcus neoformans var. grubii]OWZ36343.1 kinetochore protein Spc24 [Cryptococcus neoformans var. grubii AD2-60a]OWZ48010.1 kinetochore protein Spc24 [Cryptococcus neoformans var. grubii C23]OWZ57140.1 kinetochore protein Spc24 [Cryptococcus neoformans var. grubii AD1-83a]OWZ58274.1 kinetochore protein Spc24 [Cryptococcus neoformans var. grubii 125.91]OXC872|eukprot:XP_012046708.1 kinetochore protein Spc24, fungi type [Cryptococcus neoformans var. grubii H99]
MEHQQPDHVMREEHQDYSFNEQNVSQEMSEEGWRALAKIVRDVNPNLSPDEELGDLAAAEAAVNAKDAERTEIVDKLRDELRQLSRQHSQAATAAQRPTSHPSPAEHEANVRSLEQQQFSIAKQLNEEQAAVAKKEVELGKWKSAKEEIEKIEIGEGDWADGKVVRLKLFSEAGFSLVSSKDGSNVTKVLIRNDAKEDVHSVVVDNSRSKVYTANLIWSLASD